MERDRLDVTKPTPLPPSITKMSQKCSAKLTGLTLTLTLTRPLILIEVFPLAQHNG